MAHNDWSNRRISVRKFYCRISVPSSEPSLRKTDPACPHPRRMRRQHQVFCGQGTILDSPRTFRCRDNDQRGCAIEDIESLVIENIQEVMRSQRGRRSLKHIGFCFSGNPRQQFLVADNCKQPRLLIDGTRSLNRGVDQFA